MPANKESWMVYAKDEGISEAKAKEYWDIAKKEGGNNWALVMGIFKKIIANSKVNPGHSNLGESYMSRLDYALKEGFKKELWNDFEDKLSKIAFDRKAVRNISNLYVIYDSSDDESKMQFAETIILPFADYVEEKYDEPRKVKVAYDVISLFKEFKKTMKISEKEDKKDDNEDKKLAPFIGYAENNGIKEDQAKAIFYSVRGKVAKDNKVKTDELEAEDLAELWGEYKDAIEKAGGTRDKKDKKESYTLSKSCIVEGICIKNKAVIEVKYEVN